MAIPLTTETSLLDVDAGTVLEWQVRKPHAACVQIVAVAPDGRFKVVNEWTLYVDDLVAQNCAGEDLAPVPDALTVYSREEWDEMKAEAAFKAE